MNLKTLLSPHTKDIAFQIHYIPTYFLPSVKWKQR